MSNNLRRIGVFYDGSYFAHISNYYCYQHPRKSRISCSGLHDFIRHQVAAAEDTDMQHCQIVAAHYFRGRLKADTHKSQALSQERAFEDVLMRQSINTHYLPMSPLGREKGIDVLLALEAYESALKHNLEFCVLIAGDGDFVVLAHKLQALGTKVMVLGWNFEFSDKDGGKRQTRTSHHLIESVCYPMLMHELIGASESHDDPMVNRLFLTQKGEQQPSSDDDSYWGEDDEYLDEEHEEGEEYLDERRDEGIDFSASTGTIVNLSEGYGFIDIGSEKNLYFFHRDLTNKTFDEVAVGDAVQFHIEEGPRGPIAKNIEVLDSDNT